MNRNDVRTVDAFVRNWMAHEGLRFGEAQCAPEVLGQSKDVAQVGLRLRFPTGSKKSFFMNVYVKTRERGLSPLILLNTRVVDPGGTERECYDDVLRLLSGSVPAYTQLVTFVRQTESLKLCEDARRNGQVVNPFTLPVVQMFLETGWTFLSLEPYADAQDARRRHLIRFETLP